MNNYSVYIHKFPNGKNYVGLTKQEPNIRWGNEGYGYHNQPIYNEIVKYGWNNIEHIILFNNLSKEEAQEKEKEMIIKYDSINNGYNISTGGGLGGVAWCEFEYKGGIYSAEELAEMSEYDLTHHDITNRINSHGWDIEKAIHTPKIGRYNKFLYNGKYYTVRELYNIRINKDLTLEQIETRIEHHKWDIERALTQPNNQKNQPSGIGERIYEYKGKMYNSYELAQISSVKGINTGHIQNRINEHKWSVEDAITKPLKHRDALYKYNGEYYTTNELLQFAVDSNIKNHDITDRLRHGWSLEQALNTPKRKRQ